MKDLRAFVKQKKLSLRGIPKFDKACCMYLNNIFEQGVDLHEGTKFWAAVQDAFTAYGQKHLLIRTKRALQGWQKVDPQRPRLPIPWELIAGLVMKMVSRRRFQSGLAVLTMFSAYSDGLKLRTPFWNLHTAITERHRGQNLTAEDNFIIHRFSN